MSERKCHEVRPPQLTRIALRASSLVVATRQPQLTLVVVVITLLVPLVHEVPLDPQAHPVSLVSKDSEEKVETPVHLVHQVSEASPVLPVPKVRMVMKA